jgi:hypothetical protein
MRRDASVVEFTPLPPLEENTPIRCPARVAGGRQKWPRPARGRPSNPTSQLVIPRR